MTFLISTISRDIFAGLCNTEISLDINQGWGKGIEAEREITFLFTHPDFCTLRHL
jgi:hypothetical protein